MSNIVRILRERKSVYEKIADIAVDNTDSTVVGCADEVIARIRAFGAADIPAR